MILSDEELSSALLVLPGWRYDQERRSIGRSFAFRDFSEAFAFMTRVALAAEKADHHPNWSNGWNRVDIALTTHKAGGVTAKDIALAKVADALAASLALGGDAA